MSELREKCRGRWLELLPMFGVPTVALNGRHQACPLCPGGGGKDRFRFDNRRGEGTYFCSQCGAGDGINFLIKFKNWDFKTAAHELESVVGTIERRPVEAKPGSERVQQWMRRDWEAADPVGRYCPAGIYLANRGIVPDQYPATLRFADRARYAKDIYHPAILAVFQAPDGKVGQMHKTFITEAGFKAPVEKPRMQMPLSFPEGGAVRLGKPVNGVLGIAEGIETALAASQIFGLPVWAALNKVLLKKFEVPPGIEELFIFADNDSSFTGQVYAYGLAESTINNYPDMMVKVCVPSRIGSDWNDELLSQIKKAS